MNFKNTSVLSIGECMVELSSTGNNTYSMGFAGDTFNAAWYLRRLLPLDWEVSYFSTVGTDPTSDDMISFMRTSGINTDHIAQLNGKTAGLYMIQLKEGERSFSYWRDTSAARQLAQDADRLDAAIFSAGIVIFSGITMAILPPEGRNNLLSALGRARANGCTIVFDPNLRPHLWANTTLMCNEVSRAAKTADIVLPSFDDEKEFFGDDTPEDTSQRYCDLGVGLVVVKNGADEMLVRDGVNDFLRFTPERIENPVDTTAAGDSFNAGFLSSLISGDDIDTAIRAGAALSAKVINHHGALVEV